MAPVTRTRPVVDLDIHDEYSHHGTFDFTDTIETPASVLGELHLGNIQNTAKPTIEALTAELDNFHIDSSTKENIYDQQLLPPTRTRGRKSRPQLETNTFQLPLATQYEEECGPCEGLRAPDVSVVSQDSEGDLNVEASSSIQQLR
jgi:hypothetical protein